MDWLVSHLVPPAANATSCCARSRARALEMDINLLPDIVCSNKRPNVEGNNAMQLQPIPTDLGPAGFQLSRVPQRLLDIANVVPAVVLVGIN